MLKKICFLTLIFASVHLKPSMPEYTISSVPSAQSQIDHIKAQMLAIKRAWNSARVRIKLAEKGSPQLYQTVKTTLDKIITSAMFTTKLDTLVSSQFDAIVHNNMPFSGTTTELNLSVVYPIIMNQYGHQLFSAMANRVYCLELGKKLAQKIGELLIVVPAAQG